MTPTARATVKYVWTIQIVKKSRMCAVYSTYTVTPIPCCLLHVASLVRIRNWSLPTNFSRAKECYEVGWSDFLFYFFQKLAHCYWLAIFLWVQFQKIGKFCQVRTPRTRRNFFAFLKNHRDLENEYFFFFFAGTFILHQRTIVKNKIQT